MKKWRCKICGYVHDGDAPPEACPVCGVGAEEFEAVEEEASSADKGARKSWKCVVCEYLHAGAEPPETCPVCGVGKDQFVLLETVAATIDAQSVAEATEGTARASLEKLSYGLYILTSLKDTKINGQCINTVFQLTSQPSRMAVCLNKNNLTHEYVMTSGVFAISVLGRDHFDKISIFGYQSGRKTDKFVDVKYVQGQNGCPLLADCVAYLEARVLPDKIVDVGTHTLFVADVTAGRMAVDQEPLTYAYYRENRANVQT